MKNFYLVSFWSRSDSRMSKLVYTETAEIAEAVVREDQSFCQLSDVRLIKDPVTECGYFPEYVAELKAKG